MLELAVWTTTLSFGVLFPIADHADVVVLEDADCARGQVGVFAQGFAVCGLVTTVAM